MHLFGNPGLEVYEPIAGQERGTLGVYPGPQVNLVTNLDASVDAHASLQNLHFVTVRELFRYLSDAVSWKLLGS